jgi:hypothetical protein
VADIGWIIYVGAPPAPFEPRPFQLERARACGRWWSGQRKASPRWATPGGFEWAVNPPPRRDGNEVSADRFATFHVQNYFIAP